LTGIARNLSLRWLRARARDAAHTAHTVQTVAPPYSSDHADHDSPISG
jgi:hypothetical protein